MSRSVDLFIQSAQPIDELASEVGRLAGMTLAPGETPGTWSLDEQDVHADLCRHPYRDDGELLLDRYAYALSSRVALGKRLTDAPETNLLRVVAEALHRGGVPTLLVHDLQYRDRGTLPATPDFDVEEQSGAAGSDGAAAAAASTDEPAARATGMARVAEL